MKGLKGNEKPLKRKLFHCPFRPSHGHKLQKYQFFEPQESIINPWKGHEKFYSKVLFSKTLIEANVETWYVSMEIF